MIYMKGYIDSICEDRRIEIFEEIESNNIGG